MDIRKTLISICKKMLGIKEFTYEEYTKQIVEKIRAGGGVVGDNIRLYDVNIDLGEPYLISIGSNVTITCSNILTHDASTYIALGYSKVGPVSIGSNVFIGVRSIVLPNTKIGNNVIIGAGSVVVKDIPDNSVCVGSPCRVICSYDEYISKEKKLMNEYPVIDKFPSEILEDQESMEILRKMKRGFIK